jgi:hypothetical protein
MANQPSVLSVSAQRRLGRELFGGWKSTGTFVTPYRWNSTVVAAL